MDWKIKVLAKRNYKLSQIAKKNTKAFIAHIEKVLRLYTKEGYLKYKKQITLIADSLPDDESWAEHKDKLKRSTNGVFVYLKGTLEVKDYYTIAEGAGLDEQTIDKLVWKRAEEIYPRRQRSTKLEDIYDNRTKVTKFSRPNDKVSNVFASLTPENIERGGVNVIEFKKTKKNKLKENIVTSMIFNIPVEINNRLGLIPDPFDITVMWACITLYEAGHRKTTVPIIYKTMTGKKNSPTKETYREILSSLRKLMVFPLRIDASAVSKHYGHEESEWLWVEGIALPIELHGRGRVNGGVAEDVIVFRHESLFMRLAHLKNNQIMSYDMELLDVPVNYTRQNIPIPHYLLSRIKSAKMGQLSNKIIFDTAIQETKYTGKRERFVDLVVKCFDCWKNCGHIWDYGIEQQGRKKVAIIIKKHPKKVN